MSDIEYALMAGRAYQTTRDKMNWFPAPTDWVEILHESNSASGFEAVSFQRGDEIVISYAGTGPGFVLMNPDWRANSKLWAGICDDQLREAAAYYMAIRTAHPNAEITITGHSLGGGLASLIGVFFDETAVTFDQAPFKSREYTGVRNIQGSVLHNSLNFD